MKEVKKMECFIPSISVSFCLSSINNVDFDLSRVTSLMKIDPTKSRNKKQFPQISIDKGIAKSYWELKIEEKHCQNISIPFEKLFNLLYDKVSIINFICEEMHLNVDIVIVIRVKCGNRPLDILPKKVISFLSLIKVILTKSIEIPQNT